MPHLENEPAAHAAVGGSTGRRSAALRLAVLAPALCGAVLLGAVRFQSDQRLTGEYGLWVEDRNDTIVVHWLTADSTPGVLRIRTGRDTREFKTAPARAHAQSLRRPRTAGLTLVYGSATALDTTELSLQPPERSYTASGADSVFILADTHGEFDTVIRILRHAGLINERHEWTGGHSHLVFDGDLVDRGPDVLRLLWFVYQLEPKAARAGGRVHVLLGNHETMVWMHDLRYVNAKETSIAAAYAVPYNRLLDVRESVLGRWLASKPAVFKLDRILFAHGGVSSDFLAYTPRAVDDTLAKFLGEEWFYRFNDTTITVTMDSAAYARRAHFLTDPRSLFWYRGYVQSDTLKEELQQVLERFEADLLVVGHTPTTTAHEKYDGHFIAAHPRTPAIEMVLLVRDGRSYKRFRIDQDGTRAHLPAKSP